MFRQNILFATKFYVERKGKNGLYVFTAAAAAAKEGIINSSLECFLSIIVLVSDIQPPFYYILHFLIAFSKL